MATSSEHHAKPEDHQRVDSLIVLLSRIIYAQWSAVTSEWGLTPPMNKILRLLERRDPQPINELSEALSCTKSNLTGVIDSMVKSGLVRRVRSSRDRRVINISLTEKSRTLLRSIPPWSEIYRNSLTSRLSAREVRTLKTLLTKLHTLYQGSTERQKEEK